LKHIGEKLATFKVVILARWDSKTGEVTQLAESSSGNSGSSKPLAEIEMADGDEDD
jgi:mRNA turnover protein 4